MHVAASLGNCLGRLAAVALVNGTRSECRQSGLGDACSGLQRSAPSSPGELAPAPASSKDGVRVPIQGEKRYGRL